MAAQHFGPSPLLVFVLFVVSLVFATCTNASTWTSWTAASIIDTAIDLLEQGDAILRDNSDPLVESMKEHESDFKDIPAVEALTENFIVPILTGHLGDNNQLMEYMTTAVVARATKRTLCLAPFASGPLKHGGLHPSAIKWVELDKHKCPHGHSIRGVSVSKDDLIAAVQETAKKDNVGVVYLATAGWMRGPKELVLVKEVVNELRSSGLTVVGLWKIGQLPNFLDGHYFDLSLLNSSITKVTGHTISQIEQEICHHAYSFLGSDESTWSLSVFRSRLAERKSQQIRHCTLTLLWTYT